jgi:hypothetical protein
MMDSELNALKALYLDDLVIKYRQAVKCGDLVQAQKYLKALAAEMIQKAIYRNGAVG